MMYSWIILLAFGIWAVWKLAAKKSPFSVDKNKNTPLDILNRRFASGRITEKEYDERKQVLDEAKTNKLQNTKFKNNET